MGVFKTLFLLFTSQTLTVPVNSQEGTKNAAGQNGMLHLFLVPIVKELNTRDITKREVLTPLSNYKYEERNPVTFVGIVLEVSTPPQKVIVEPDTGSLKF